METPQTASAPADRRSSSGLTAVGYGITFLTGLLVLGPQAKRIGQLMETKGPNAAETQAAIQRILLVARVDVGVLLLVVADMILRPFT
jgi:hypothetical protein